MRQSALCDQNSRILQDREHHGSRSFFSEIVASISDIKFAKDGRHILSRDYMNLKLWDLHMENSPIATYKIHEHLRPKLAELYNSDSIFDKFGCCLSSNGSHFATGSYRFPLSNIFRTNVSSSFSLALTLQLFPVISNSFRIFCGDGGTQEGITLEASRNPYRISHLQSSPKSTRMLTNFARGHNRRGHDSLSSDANSGIQCDVTSKVIHMAWHPTADLVACAAANSLYMYHA